jgi:hypothetical protein
MSTFVDEAINPKTGQSQQALFIDDYYSSHRYGVGFRDDGADASLYDMKNRDTEYTVYPLEEIKTELAERHLNDDTI